MRLFDESRKRDHFGFRFWLHKAMSSRNVVLASAGYDGVIRFWDISGGHTKRTLKYEDNPELKVKMVMTDRVS